MSQVIITRGVMASGKSTGAAFWVADGKNRIRVNRDDIRYQLYGTYWGAPIDENVVSAVEESMILAGLKAGQDVIVDATHLAAKNANRIAKIARKGGADKISFMDFPVTLDLAITRDRFRQAKGERHVGEDVIVKTFERFHINPTTGVLPKAPRIEQFKPLVFEPYVPGPIDAYSFDIDGTVARGIGDVRGPFETSKYHLDYPDESLARVVGDVLQLGYVAIFLSGRNEDFRKETEAWLQKYIVGADDNYILIMRPTHQPTENDAWVKSELVDKYISNQYNIIMHYDDRNRVVDALRSKGMKVAQVMPGDF